MKEGHREYGLPQRSNILCPGSSGKDGMPVTLSHTIDQRTLEKEDFQVVSRSGAQHTPSCVTLAPATGAGELRTVLLTGELGSADDPAVTVRVVGDIISDGVTGGPVNFRGAEAADNDNNHRLCLDVTDTALSVSFPAGHVVDPNGDLNPNTNVAVTR